MSYAGTNTQCQLSIESVWGTNPGTGDTLLAILSEGMKYNIDTASEETLLAGKTVSGVDIMGVGVEGDLSLYVRPSTIGYLLALSFGEEGTPSVTSGGTLAYDHIFTLIEADAASSLPSTTVIVDRKAAVKAYTGCKVDSIEFSASAKEYLKCKLNLKGKSEETGTIDSGLSNPTSYKPFRFIEGTVNVNGASAGYITSFTTTVSNNLDDGEPVLGSGIYGTETEVQGREVALTLECFYDASSELIRENYFKTGNAISVDLIFESTAEAESGIPYTFKLELPNVVISDANPPVSGKEKVKMTINGTGIETSGEEPITATIIDLKSDAYI